MTKIRIYLKSGSIIDAEGPEADFGITRNAYNELTRVDWEGITIGEEPMYIRVSEIEAVTVIREDPDGLPDSAF